MLGPAGRRRHSAQCMTVGPGWRDGLRRNDRPRDTFATQGRKRSFGHDTEWLQSSFCVRAPDLDGDCNGCAGGSTPRAGRTSTSSGPACGSGPGCSAPHGRATPAHRGTGRTAYRCTARSAFRRSSTTRRRAAYRSFAAPTPDGAAHRCAAGRAAHCGGSSARSAAGGAAVASRRASWRATPCRNIAWFAARRTRANAAAGAQTRATGRCGAEDRRPTGAAGHNTKCTKCARAQPGRRRRATRGPTAATARGRQVAPHGRPCAGSRATSVVTSRASALRAGAARADPAQCGVRRRDEPRGRNA